MEKVKYSDFYFTIYLQHKILTNLDSRGKYTTEYVAKRKWWEDLRQKEVNTILKKDNKDRGQN